MRYSAVTSFGIELFHALGELLRERPDLFLERAANDRHVHVDAAGAGGLREVRHLQSVERFMDEQGGLADLLECRAPGTGSRSKWR